SFSSSRESFSGLAECGCDCSTQRHPRMLARDTSVRQRLDGPFPCVETFVPGAEFRFRCFIEATLQLINLSTLPDETRTNRRDYSGSPRPSELKCHPQCRTRSARLCAFRHRECNRAPRRCAFQSCLD